MSAEQVPQTKPVARGWALGVKEDRVVIYDRDKEIVVAAFAAPQAAVLAALLIRHACTIASGLKDVDNAIEDSYGSETPPDPAHG